MEKKPFNKDTQPSTYILGDKLSTLGDDIKAYLIQEMHAIEYDSDISVITLHDTEYAFFVFNGKNTKLLVTSIKVCINLSKYLYVLHDSCELNHINYNSPFIKQIDTSTSSVYRKLRAVLQKHQAQHNTHPILTNITHEQHDFPNIGSKIDLTNALEFIEDNLESEIHEAEVAALCHYSTSYFSKLFHESVGMTFRDYLVNRRINLAKQLLVHLQKDKIASIAYQCGYNDVAYFSRIFKKRTGYTPGSYRKLHINQMV